MEYGLIGAKLGHSYSKVIHEMLCGYRYDLCPLPTEEEVRAFLTRRQFRAINVTIPYKLVVMEYCSYIDPHAKAINAVNTIVNRNGLLYGYNTDYPGFSYLCDAHGVEFKDRTVLILGTGGTHNTTWAVAHDRGAKQIYTVSRHPDPEKGELTYAQALTTGAQIIINTTPVGMYPNVGVSALDITSMPGLEAVIDVIYNPDKTELILRAEELGVPVAVGGLEMLVAQAVYAAEFFLDFLIEDKKGRLVTCPSVSPENTYLTASGSKGSICIGPSMDSQIIYELFTAVAEASKILETDGGFRKKVLEARDRLPAPEIGKYGQIMEWAEDYDEVEPGHRHISQLFALYPADIITMRKTPELAKAARATLERRLSHGGGHTGWSRAWIINHWARLFDGEKVYENVIALLSNSTSENMFDMHPPFQIDGNFGGTAGITEALLQSENGEIILLPALPKGWSEGSFKGLCARGGFVIDLEWKDSKITACHIHSRCGKKCRIVCDSVKVHTASSEVQTLYTDGAAEFDTETGKTYTLTF